jgi:PadR family transcriptional regulator PadR
MREALGEFEQLVLIAILQLDGDIYAARIVEESERRTGRSTASAAVYITLRRLEEKKLVDSRMSDPRTCAAANRAAA